MRPITGTHVLLGLIAFFGVMLAVNGAFVYFATSTFSGLSTEDPYRKGVAYNQTLSAYRAQAATGWHASAALDGQKVRLAIADSEGKPVEDLAITGRIGRPATDAEDRPLVFQSFGRGLYVADAAALHSGVWELAAEAHPAGSADDPPFKVTARLWVP